MKTFFGYKTGMTQAWTKSGQRLPITVIRVSPMTISQVKQVEIDGYTAVKVNVDKQQREIRIDQVGEYKAGDSISVDQVVQSGDIVNITATSKGQGFAGPMKRWGFKGGPKTHGQSDRWRAPGSIGQGTTPGRINKGKHMAGHFGQHVFTLRNLQVVNINKDTNELWVSGPVPGKDLTLVEINVVKSTDFEGLR